MTHHTPEGLPPNINPWDHPELTMRWTAPEIKWIQAYATNHAREALRAQAASVPVGINLDTAWIGYARIENGEYKLASMRSHPAMAHGELHPIYTFTEAEIEAMHAGAPPSPASVPDLQNYLTSGAFFNVDDADKPGAEIGFAHAVAWIKNQHPATSPAQAVVQFKDVDLSPEQSAEKFARENDERHAAQAVDAVDEREAFQVWRTQQKATANRRAEGDDWIDADEQEDGFKAGYRAALQASRQPQAQQGGGEVDDKLLEIARRLSLATDEGDDKASGTHYIDKQGAIRCKGSFLALIEDARTALATKEQRS